MLCCSGVFGCKMLNLPRGPSGNDSREVFYVCVSPLGVDLTDENLPWSSTAFLFYLTVFLKNIYSAFPQRPLLVTNWKVVHTLGNRLRYTLWLSRQKTLIARRGWRQLSNVRKQRPTPLPTKIIFFFLSERKSALFASPLPLPLLCRRPWPCAEWRDEAGFPELWREGQGGWFELSTPKIWLCSQRQNPAPLLCCPKYLGLGQTGEDLLHMWCFLTCILNSSTICSTVRYLQYNYTTDELGPKHFNISLSFYCYSTTTLYLCKYQNFLCYFLSYFSLLLANLLESFALCVAEQFLCGLSLAVTKIPFLFVFQVSILKKGK